MVASTSLVTLLNVHERVVTMVTEMEAKSGTNRRYSTVNQDSPSYYDVYSPLTSMALLGCFSFLSPLIFTGFF